MKTLIFAIAALGAVMAAPAANAANLITNGDFEQTANGSGQLGYNTDAIGWTTANNGYNFIFAPNSADTTGSDGQYGNLQLWGLNNGGIDTLSNSPSGGNFVGADGGFQVGAISQTINGLTAGQKYVVSFDWAGAQQSGFTSPTTEQWNVSLGDQTQSTEILNDANHGFTGWRTQSFTFTATGASEVLSFLAAGTPSGEPPLSLLDHVTMSAVPEPGSWALMLIGIGGIGVAMRLRRKAGPAKTQAFAA
jgi:hypothetical protein